MASGQNDRLFDFADDFVLSSGTVTVDCSRSLVLLLYYKPKDEYLLPKGRKNIGETLSAAAVRETTEESGYRCHLLTHSLPTRATSAKSSTHAEPIAIQQRTSQGVRKIIFWYLAGADSTKPRLANTQEEGEDFEPHWVSFEDAVSQMSFEQDRKLVEKALSAIPDQLSGGQLRLES